MSSILKIEQKLEAFIRRYYLNQLLRGLIFLLAIGLSYLLIVLLVEYFFWLRPAGRAILFWSFVALSGYLVVRFVVLPLARLFKLSKGIDFKEASSLIGNHFPEVSDKLMNTLELHVQMVSSELIAASIAQKSAELEPIPFSLAIDYRKNLKYTMYALIPLAVFVLVNFASKDSIFSSSYERMVNYDKAYQPPAPFSFFVTTDSLVVIEHTDFDLNVVTMGDQVPENAQLHLDGSTFFMRKGKAGSFGYSFKDVGEDQEFYIMANGVRSVTYTLNVIKAPAVSDFEMTLDFPAHTGRKAESIKNTGSLEIPEGTTITWNILANATTQIEWMSKDTTLVFDKGSKDLFTLEKRLLLSTEYHIATSNEQLKRYEDLAYRLEVVKDAYPKIDVSMKVDTLTGQQQFLKGMISDDYGLRTLQLVYYEEETEQYKIRNMAVAKGNVDEFLAVFPDTLSLKSGINYAYYFQVVDNDAVNGFKKSKSNVFSYRNLSVEEKEDKQLQEQKSSIDGLDKMLQRSTKNDAELQKLAQSQKEEKTLNYSKQQELKKFLEDQRKQDEMMQGFTDKLKRNLDNFQEKEMNDPKSEQLQKRMEANEERLKDREKMLKELDELREKLGKEELSDKLDELAKQNKTSKKSLKQLLELTKQYYVEEKMQRLARNLDALGSEQKQLAVKKEENTIQKQKKLSDEFKELEKDFEDIKKENQGLVKPIDLPEDKKLQKEIGVDQKLAEEALKRTDENQTGPEKEGEKNEGKETMKKAGQQKQKQAGEKMQQLAGQMKEEMSASEGETIQEDVDILRQILDNLILFSFNQEALMKEFKAMDTRSPVYSKKLVRQQELKENFAHVDDSLFALSLRVAQLEEKITEELNNVDYSLSQALDRLSQNQVSSGSASQQYVVTASNELAEMLSAILGNMQQSMGKGKGKGKSGQPKPGQGGSGKQLQDIIQSQQELMKELGKQGRGKDSKEGQGQEGEKGKGQQKNGKGQEGKDGQGDKQGENGAGGSSEQERARQYEIFKQQQQIRKELEELIKQHSLGKDAGRLSKEMEKIEDALINGRMDSAMQRRMQELEHQLLKLAEAEQKQGEEQKRTSTSNRKEFDKNKAKPIEEAKKYFNTKELLSRDALQFNGIYKPKVQAYFGNDGD